MNTPELVNIPDCKSIGVFVAELLQNLCAFCPGYPLVREVRKVREIKIGQLKSMKIKEFK